MPLTFLSKSEAPPYGRTRTACRTLPARSSKTGPEQAVPMCPPRHPEAL